MESKKISAFIICKNEEPVIENALKSLKFADEIIVVDGQSTDKTVSLVQKYTSKIFIRPWTNFGEQRNFALSHCKMDWVFYLDSDEVVSDELNQWIMKFKKGVTENLKDSPVDALVGPPKNQNIELIEIRRFEHFKGRRFLYGADNPSYQWRLFKREGSTFRGEVHEYPVVEGKVMRLEAPILHFPKSSISELMDKINRYSTMEAENMYKRGMKRGVLYMYFSGLSMFLKAYFRKRGYKDGTLGFILAVLAGTTFFLRQAKLYCKNYLQSEG